MLRRRQFIQTGAGLLALGTTGTAYAAVIEPGFRLVIQEYRLSLPGWAPRPPLTICIIADIHAGEPWMPLSRVHRIVAAANALAPGLHVVLGDLPAHHRFVTGRVPMPEVAAALSHLRAPLGTWAILGNHDWWDDPETQLAGRGPPAIRGMLETAGVPVLVNAAQKLPHGAGVWLAGTDSALAFGRRRPGADNLARTLAPLLHDDAPAILLAHEPDIFARVPNRVALTLSGHTHGGQVRLAGHSPIVPSHYGNRYAYGLVHEQGRHLVVSGGLGCSILPVRLGVPPEITVVHLS